MLLSTDKDQLHGGFSSRLKSLQISEIKLMPIEYFKQKTLSGCEQSYLRKSFVH